QSATCRCVAPGNSNKRRPGCDRSVVPCAGLALEGGLVTWRKIVAIAVDGRVVGRMNAALGLVPAAPAAGTGVFARLDHAGAGLAADREIAFRFERVAREVMLGEVGVEIGLGPVAERVHLQPAVLDLEAGQVLAGD